MKKTTRTRRIRRGGFTLIEVLLVLAILGVIAAMVVPNLLGRQQEANIKTTKQSISAVENAAKMFAVDHDGEYPPSLNELVQPEMIGGMEKQPYLEKPPTDAWGMPIQYEPPQQAGQKPMVRSFGPNKQEGGGDDITNLDDDPNYGGQQI